MVEKIGQLQPQLVTFNGHSFDLPVLRYRAMVNRVSAAGLQVRPYFRRYADDALDLCDVLGSYVSGSKVKLDEVSKILGLTGKPEGVDGSRVEEMVLAGQIDEVARYCESDVLKLIEFGSCMNFSKAQLTPINLLGVRRRLPSSSGAAK